jgi:hypothetical protein
MTVKSRHRTEILIETHERLVIRTRTRAVSAWCPECGARVQMLRPEQVAVVEQTTTRAIYRRVEAGEIHFTETARGELLICPYQRLLGKK